MRLVVSPDAEGDFDQIIQTSSGMFGEAAAHRYRRLIQHAFADVLARPDRPSAPGLPEDFVSIRSGTAGRTWLWPTASANPATFWSTATTGNDWRSSASFMIAWTFPPPWAGPGSHSGAAAGASEVKIDGGRRFTPQEHWVKADSWPCWTGSMRRPGRW